VAASTSRVQRTAAPLRQQVVKLLREDILGGDLTPGQRLVESALCESYDVSRTVIREALRQLETENLITVLAGRGPIVTVLTQDDIEALYEVRARLEGLAGELFARKASEAQRQAMIAHMDRMEEDYRNGTVESRERVNNEFYALLLEGCGNSVLREGLSSIHARIIIFRRFAFVDEGRVAISMKALGKIVDEAVVRRDPDAARRACEEHIRVAGELALVEYLRWVK
jgi:DNA-binding GntR family transcriptional regulator